MKKAGNQTTSAKKGRKAAKGLSRKQARQVGRAAARSVERDARWGFKLAPTEWGPFRTKGLEFTSRSTDPTMVGLGSRAIDIQREMPRLATSVSENGNVVDVLTGTDLLGTVSLPDAATAGDILFKQEISPSKFASTRLAQFADLYQRYRFRRIEFVYEPVANATQSGQLLGYADFDIDNQLVRNDPTNLQIGAAHQGQAITQIWQPMVFDMGQVFTFTDLYTEQGQGDGSDPRLSVQGIFYLLAASAIPANQALGNIYVRYEIEFSIPFLSAKQARVLSCLMLEADVSQDAQAYLELKNLQNTSIDVGALGVSPAIATDPGVAFRVTGATPGQYITIWGEYGPVPYSGYQNAVGPDPIVITIVDADYPNTIFTSGFHGVVNPGSAATISGVFVVRYVATSENAGIMIGHAGTTLQTSALGRLMVVQSQAPATSRSKEMRHQRKQIEKLEQELANLSIIFQSLTKRNLLGESVGTSDGPRREDNRVHVVESRKGKEKGEDEPDWEAVELPNREKPPTNLQIQYGELEAQRQSQDDSLRHGSGLSRGMAQIVASARQADVAAPSSPMLSALRSPHLRPTQSREI